MNHEALSADTEVVLLLCGRFGGEREEPFAPLSARDYGGLAQWLKSQGLRPADLMTDAGRAKLQQVHEVKLERQRLEFLLGRGTAMALALERWSRGGLWVISRGDEEFPKRLKRHLKHAAPPLLYGAGNKELLDMGGVAIIGSRDATESALEFTRDIAAQCAREKMGVVSGGARGVDSAAMQGATEAGGRAIGVLASDLLKASVNRQNRLGLQDGQLVLVSPFYPEAGFNAGNAMGRNKYIYALSDRGLVIDSALGSGGTWEGALEALQHRWVPLYVRTPGHGLGNAVLVEKGGLPFTYVPRRGELLSDVFDNEVSSIQEVAEPEAVQPSLLDIPAEAGTAESPQPKVSDLAAEQAPAEVPAEMLTVSETTVSLASALTESANHGATASTEAPIDAARFSSLDMYGDFLRQLALALASAPLTDEQISDCLGLERSQAKAWLKRALEDECVEKLKKPVRYSLRRQRRLG